MLNRKLRHKIIKRLAGDDTIIINVDIYGRLTCRGRNALVHRSTLDVE